MKNGLKDTTAIIIATIISLIAIISFTGAFYSKLAILETEVVNINKEIISIKVMLDNEYKDIKKILSNYDTEIKSINNRLVKIEHKVGI